MSAMHISKHRNREQRGREQWAQNMPPGPPGGFTNLPLALTRFFDRSSRWTPPPPEPACTAGRAVRVSLPCPTPPSSTVPVCIFRPPFCSSLASRYIRAACESGIGDVSATGGSAPLRISISATWNDLLRLPDVLSLVALGDAAGDDLTDGDAGSAAARARKTAWVFRDRSCTFGSAPSASA